MNSFADNSSRTLSLECFTSNNDANKGAILEDLLKALENHENRPFIIKEIILINLGVHYHPQEQKIGKYLNIKEQENFPSLLQEFIDVFTWSYKDMSGTDRDIVISKIPLHPDAKPIKQRLRMMKSEQALKLKKEIQKQFDVGFIRLAQYAELVANVVPVLKNDGRVRMCIDFRDLNKACPKDDFPLPHIHVLDENTARYGLLSFMDGYVNYNEVKMVEEHMEKTTFIIPQGNC